MTGRTAIVTGAASGIGAATVEYLRHEGWLVHGVDLVGGEGIVRADVSDPDSLAAAAAELGDAPLHGLVCAAGIWPAGDDRYSAVGLDVWERTWAVNVTGTMLTLRTFAPRLVYGGAVATIASIVALAGFPRRDAYTASKGAVLALSRAWAADLVRRGVRVNCICPGVVDTPMTDRGLAVDTTTLPLGRLATPTEIAGVIGSTLDARAGYLNGAVIPVDGGLTAAAGTVPLSPRVARTVEQ